MKKIIILSIILTSAFTMNAQTSQWIGQGATWYYTWSATTWGGNNKIEYTHDTVLFGKTCQILKTTEYTYVSPGPWLPIILLSTQVLPNNYTYSNGDTVFYLNNNHFSVLYNFGAQVNDRWDLGVDTNGGLCSRSIVKVDSTSSITINSSTHQVLYTSDSANSSVGIYGKIIEHIGSMDYLFPTGRNCDPQSWVDFYMYDFSCFQDYTMSYIVVDSAECQNPYHVGMSKLSRDLDQIQCYPNPVEDKLNIRFFNETNYRINIYNILGEKMIATKNPMNQSIDIDLSNVAPGIYIATFENSSGEKINKRIIKK